VDLGRAILIASTAHRNQVDRHGRPYILHPLRLMFKFQHEREMITAVLHDLIEHTEWTLEELKAEGFSSEVVDAVNALTRRTGESYWDLIERAKRNSLARRIKIADLEDNMDLRFYRRIGEEDRERLKRYHKAWLLLTEKR
jgi:(p)ppGpp synthase/HD superfamily hydrolase